MEKNKTGIVDRVYSQEKDLDFKTVVEIIIDNKIEDLVHNANKVNTATSQEIQKGSDKS